MKFQNIVLICAFVVAFVVEKSILLNITESTEDDWTAPWSTSDVRKFNKSWNIIS